MSAFTPGDAESFVAAYFPNAKPRGHGQWSARCPAHDDASPSLSIGQGERGVLLKCFAGCTVEAVCRALGIQVGALSRSVQVATGVNGRGRATGGLDTRRTEYLYRDEHGTPLYRRTRVDTPDGHKKIWQDRAVGGRWESGLADTRRVLYRLPELVHADPSEVEAETAPAYYVHDEAGNFVPLREALAALGYVTDGGK